MNGPSIINDRYEIIKRIGRGGMADVFLGRDKLLDRQVAIKVLFPEFAVDPNFVERFRREAQAAANLNHPNIVNVFDWGKGGSTYYIAMEYVDGRTLADILRSVGRLTSKQAAEIAGEVAAALGFAHAAGLVHRDIKPANILIGTTGSVKVADFGIARALNSPTESNLTQAGAVMGTATYFSPEQAQGAQPDPRSDLYSLGVVMYEMIAGRPPFTGENPVAIAYKQVHDYPRPLNEFVVDVPRAFEAIVAKLLTKDPNVRYSSADAVREDLRRFRNGEMPVALMAAATARSTAQTPTLVGPASRRGGPPTGSARPSQQMTAVQRTAGSGRPGSRPVTGPVPAGNQRGQGQRTGWYTLAAFFALVALGIGGFLLFTTLSRENDANDDLALRDYTGMPIEDVIADLTAKDLNYRPHDDQTDDAYEPGIVFRTDPGAGTIVAAGNVIDVYYNPVEEVAEIPNVAGETVEAAQQALTDAGFLAISVEFEQTDAVELGRVIRTDPTAGETVNVSSPVTIVAATNSGDGGPPSSDPASVDVPFVIGLSEAGARSKLAEAGLEVEVVYIEGPLGNSNPDEVLDQSPRTNQSIEAGGTVTINVGRATTPATTQRPNTTSPPPQPTSPPTSPTTPPTPAPTATPTTAAPTTQATTTVAPTTTVPPGP